MSLSPGTRLGPYEIVSLVGAGGMGEVYRAKDTTLDRDVAIKVLPESFAADADRVARFQREAKTLASLNHPNIGAIYGIEDRALVMELVEGEDLSALISRGPIPLADAVPIARQIIEALEAAHDQGIVHRDLKPANIKVRADGTVKVLDFGLARTFDGGSGADDIRNSPTLTARATQMGMIIGTAAYMSPEQARGRVVDRRADIWAFGVVLYEMLTGRRAFEGEDISITLASVLKEDVNWDALPADLPAPIQRLLRRTLDKDPKSRLSAIGDARFELNDALTAGAGAPSTTVVRGASVGWSSAWFVGGALLAAAAAILTMPLWHREPELLPVRFTVATPESDVLSSPVFYPSVSPNGRVIAYAAPESPSGPTLLWIRPIDSTIARALAGTENAAFPFWSPDSQSVAFAANGTLKRVDVAGGGVQPLCNVATFAGGTWNQRNEIVFAGVGTALTLRKVPASGGPSEPWTELDVKQGELAHAWPTFLPDGRHVMYLVSAAQPHIEVRSLDGGAPTRLVDSDSQAEYSAGFLIFQRQRSLFAQPFDPAAVRVSGEPRMIIDGVILAPPILRGAFASSSSGVLTYRTGLRSAQVADLVWTDRRGKPLGTVGDPAIYDQLRLSPDNKRVAMSAFDSKGSVSASVLDLSNGITSRLTDGAGGDPVWSPDSESVGFEAIVSGKRDFYRQSIGGRARETLFESPQNPKWLDDWSRDGKFLIYHVPSPGAAFAAPLQGGGVPQLLVNSTALLDGIHLSNDGRWFVYSVNESGVFETWIASFPSGDHRRQITLHGGGQAWWRQDDGEIFFLTPDGKMMAVTVTPDKKSGAVEVETPRLLFQSPLDRPNLTVDQYAVTRDGARFLFIQPRKGQSSKLEPLTVVVNWAAGLGRPADHASR